MTIAAFVFRPEQFTAELVLEGFLALGYASPIPDAFAGERLVARPLENPTREHALTAVFYVPPGLDSQAATEAQWETFQLDDLPHFVLQKARASRASFCCYVVLWDGWGHDLCGWKLEHDAVELRSIVGDQALVDIEFLDSRPPKHREREMRFRGKKAFDSGYSILRMLDRELSLSLLQLQNACLPALRPDSYPEAIRRQNRVLYPPA